MLRVDRGEEIFNREEREGREEESAFLGGVFATGRTRGAAHAPINGGMREWGWDRKTHRMAIRWLWGEANLFGKLARIEVIRLWVPIRVRGRRMGVGSGWDRWGSQEGDGGWRGV
jgi:hypothetical protein